MPLQKYLDRFTEAWDPENGIEEAYWPDKDAMHCWRTMRMSMQSSVEHLDLAVNGAGAMVRGILRLPETPKVKEPDVPETTTNDDDTAGDSAVATLDTSKDSKAEAAETEAEKPPSTSVTEERRSEDTRVGRREERRDERRDERREDRRDASRHSEDNMRPPTKRARSDDSRAKDDEVCSCLAWASVMVDDWWTPSDDSSSLLCAECMNAEWCTSFSTVE